jgi:hypothetical protein
MIIGKPFGAIETITVTVSAGATSGTATAKLGRTILGVYPAGNQDQFVTNVAISGKTVTITLGAAATADNVFTVVLI